MYQYKLEKNNNGYDIVLYLNQDSEFANEFKSDDKRKTSSIKDIYEAIKKDIQIY